MENWTKNRNACKYKIYKKYFFLWNIFQKAGIFRTFLSNNEIKKIAVQVNLT